MRELFFLMSSFLTPNFKEGNYSMCLGGYRQIRTSKTVTQLPWFVQNWGMLRHTAAYPELEGFTEKMMTTVGFQGMLFLTKPTKMEKPQGIGQPENRLLFLFLVLTLFADQHLRLNTLRKLQMHSNEFVLRSMWFYMASPHGSTTPNDTYTHNYTYSKHIIKS